MNKRTYYWIGGLAVVGVAAWYYTRSKQAYARTIVRNGGASNFFPLLRFDKEYLKEWAKATRLGTATFLYNGKMYKTTGGKTV